MVRWKRKIKQVFFKSLKRTKRLYSSRFLPAGPWRRKRKRQNKGPSVVGITLQTDGHSWDEISWPREQNGKHVFLYGHYFLFLEYTGLFHSFVQMAAHHLASARSSLFIGLTFPTLDSALSASHSWWPSSRSLARTFRILLASQESVFREKYGNDNKHVYQNFYVGTLGMDIEF